MTETKFTPGPWELVSLSGYGNPFSVRMPYIADTAKPDQTHYGIQSIRRREDANLVVAAPDLFEATTPFEVIAMDRAVYSPEWRNQDCITMVISIGELRAIKAARAKARGEA